VAKVEKEIKNLTRQQDSEQPGEDAQSSMPDRRISSLPAIDSEPAPAT
jgi:hypothetical protein